MNSFLLTPAAYMLRSDDLTGFACFLGFLIIVGLAIAALVSSANRQAKELAQAKAAYQNSLARLKSKPTSADLRQRTLELGRAYSNLTRNKKGVTVFDEVALMNDINAACAGAAVSPQTNKIAAKPSIEDRLAKLSELKSKGLIDEQEYNSRRQKILDEV
jgi:hypothetical protein